MAPRPALERLSSRPRPGDWRDDELVTLAEAAALFFPDGPLTAKSLRAAFQRGELACARVCAKIFTTPRAVRDMATARVPAQAGQGGHQTPSGSADALARLNRRLYAT